MSANQSIDRLLRMGVDYDDALALRRISMTLQRWFELECGDGNDWASWAIERDETSGKPYMVTYPHDGKERRSLIADRETGARKRLDRIMAKYPALVSYIQGDPRGASLYILSKSDLRPGDALDCVYTRGVAVYR